MKKTTFLFGLGLMLSFAALNAGANEHLLRHVQALGQSMSAMFMVGLSHGNEKYIRELEFYSRSADGYLQQYIEGNGLGHESLNASWVRIKDQIKVEYREDYEWDPDERFRRAFRAHQTEAYGLVEEQISTYNTAPLNALLRSTQVETMTGRFFDISTGHKGTLALTPNDVDKVDLHIMSAQLKEALNKLAGATHDDALKRKLKSALLKWEFIEKSVVDYSGLGAHYVVYATKNHITKVLSDNTLLTWN